MTNTTDTIEAITSNDLADVTGGGIGTQIGSLFGPKGQQWGGLADNILGILGGLGGGGGLGSILGGLGGASSGAPQTGSSPQRQAPQQPAAPQPGN